MLFLISDIRFWQAGNGVLAIWKRKKQEERRPFPWSFPLPFPGYGNLYFRYFFGALHCEHCFFDNKALGRYETERDCTPYI